MRNISHYGRTRANPRAGNPLRALLIAFFVTAQLLPTAAVRATDLPGVYPAALDQPRINAVLRRTPTGPVLSANVGGETVYNIEAFFDTGASGVLLSNDTADALGVQRLRYPDPVTGQLVQFEDVGVAGSDTFNVSEQLHVGLSRFLEPFDSPALSSYTQTFGPIRLQISPPNPNPQLEGLDVFGVPTMAGKVVVMDPKPSDPFGAELGTMHTFVYNPGTPFNPGTAGTNPGIPLVDRHIDLSYASFDRFTKTTPAGAPGPTLRENPFIGPNPLLQLDPNPPADNTPGVSITFGAQSSTGSWLLDTGAAASIISLSQAANLHVRYRAGTEGTDNPQLETYNPANPGAQGQLIADQFTLTVGGIGGTTKKAGFFLDSLLMRTMEGNPANNNDPNHIRYTGAAVLVSDITLKDPGTQQTLTLDGVFGMNMLVGSAWFDEETFQFLGLADGYYNWLTFDEPNGVLGLDLKDVITLPPNEWIHTTGGNWGDVANWSNGVIPNANDVAALLGSAITANANVDLQSTNRTVRSLRFSHPGKSYNVTSSGGGMLILDAASGPAAIQFDTANSASHEISAPLRIKSNVDFYGIYTDLQLTLSGGQTWDAGRSLTVRSGVLRYNLDNADAVAVGGDNALVIDDGAKVILAGARSPLGAGANAVDVINNSAGGFEVAAGNHEAGFIAGTGSTSLAASTSLIADVVQQSALTLGAGSRLTMRNNGSSAAVSVVGSLSIAGGATPTATVDLANNAAVIDYTGTSPAATVRAQILAGRGGAGLGKPWNGPGITSSTAQADVAASPNSRSVGYAENAALPLGAYTNFRGHAVDATSILMAYTRTGDANLDGVVNDDDVTVVGTFYAPGVSKPEWAKGDFDYNGFVDDDDVTLLGVFYNPAAMPIPAPTAEAGSEVAAVPEPATITLLWSTLLLLFALRLRVEKREFR